MTARRVLLVVETSDQGHSLKDAVPLLRSRDVDPIVATVRPPGPLHDELTAVGVENLSLGATGSWHYPVSAGRLARIIVGRKIDLVHASEAIAASIAAVGTQLSRRATCLYHRHHLEPEGSPRVARFASRWSDHTMAVSWASARRAHRDDGVPFERICVAHNGIEPIRTAGGSEVVALRASIGIPSTAAVVVCVSRLRPVKGVDVAIRAMADVRRGSSREVRLVVVGDGPDRTRLEALRHSSGVAGSVHLVGHQADIAPWLGLADAVVVPSLGEAFGLAAVEAMSVARPVVASRVGGLEEVIVDGETGMLVPAGDVETLARSLLQVLEDRPLAERLAAAGRARQRREFSTEAMVSGWADCYEVAMARKR